MKKLYVLAGFLALSGCVVQPVAPEPATPSEPQPEFTEFDDPSLFEPLYCNNARGDFVACD
jgi:hypothetical protein